MGVKYVVLDKMPRTDLMEVIVSLHQNVFGADNLVNKIKDKQKLLFNLALDGEKLVGYKIGYELDKNKFYSWLGGGDSSYRKQCVISINI
ncbi:hypothetical protein HNQ35_001944 [Cerasibacillus quisquiliarum]|uniref:N-acetyltransferase domain-containing protein n=1 Tax=Cerasibacillus quisquiliarum TaxID=227865 RepID=A0A511UY21_9BACI|nr:hypothetical protein [Cerasibacillus quisquiliarum]MBB5146734.1 hypothetical protein [Cerasibacillus quisquiliarum]GEN31534.1 hypothetical protein CQU01_17720 [Cerasibacillus quisquiliarum]